MSLLLRAVATLLLAQACQTAQAASDDPPAEVPAHDRVQVATEKLGKLIRELEAAQPLHVRHPVDALTDIRIFHKAASWASLHGQPADDSTAAQVLEVLEVGTGRAQAALSGHRPWLDRTGTIACGYVSKIDGSTQPYAVVVPEEPLGPDARHRLDVVLHGRDDRLTEVKFLSAHRARPAPAGLAGLVLHVYGRGNNAYRWAGETDVLEAIDAVRRTWRVDDQRIVLRGFSMGGAGAWHLGLHHPARWCAVEAGAGFTDTRRYLGRDDFTPVETKLLRIYDAVDAALNASIVPCAGYGGELDKQLQASTNIRDALEALGFPVQTDGLVTSSPGIGFLRVVGAGTGHKVDPPSESILRGFRDEHASAGRPEVILPIRFTTTTLRYNEAGWLSLERLLEHHVPAVVEARLDAETQAVIVERADNVAMLGVDRRAGESLRIGGQEFPLLAAVGGYLPRVYYRMLDDHWEMLDYEQSRAHQDNTRGLKVPGVQGPIDDAFSGPFLCVRGTGQPWNPNSQQWADRRLVRFRDLWSRYLRADLPLKDDAQVTPEEIATRSLVLFGDPGSNDLIRQLLPRLPVVWSRDSLHLGSLEVGSADHTVALIAPNPMNPKRYVVLNSGHTFEADAFSGSNALLYPRLGDYAVFRLSSPDGELLETGFFDETWKPISRARP